MVVLDTCAVLELCQVKPGISSGCLREIEKGCFLLSVSFAEIALKVKRKRLILDLPPESLYESYREIPTVRIVDIGCPEWFDSIHLEWDNKDPADRLIVSYARRRKISVVTTDARIKRFYREVLW